MTRPARRRWEKGAAAVPLVLLLVTAGACDSPVSTGSPPGPLALEEAWAFPSLPPADFVTAFDFDGSGTLWVLTFQGTILRVEGDATTSFDASAILGGEGLRDLYVDPAGRPWIAGGASVAVYDGGAWSVQGPPSLMGLAPVASEVAVNAAGDVLVAMGHTLAGGLLLRRAGTWSVLTPAADGLPSPVTRDLEAAPDGSFWVGFAEFRGRGGVGRIAGDELVRTWDAEFDGLLYDWVDDLEIGGGAVWIGYEVFMVDGFGIPDGGLQRIPLGGGAPDSWFPFVSGLTSNRVRALEWTSRGELWFTTGLDQDPVGCQTCFSGVGMLDGNGRFQVVSTLNSDVIAPNAFLPWIREGPDGDVYVAEADGRRILRVVR